MPTDIASILLTLTLSMLTMAVALLLVMGAVNAAARRAQIGVLMQAIGWALLLASGLAPAGGWLDRTLSTLAMAGISGGLALNATAFNLWCGRPAQARAPAIVAVLLTAGYGLGFGSYAFRVGWANGLLSLQMAIVAATLWRRPQVAVGRWRWLLVVALVAQIVVTFWRGALGAFTDVLPNFFTPHPVNIAFALVANATAMLSLVAILLAHHDEAARALEDLATIDGVTGVLNRRAWLKLAEVELEVSTRYGHPLAVLMIDLDHFKKINDRYGHLAGDHALKFFATALRAASRAGDVVCRYGGEEFCVLMKRADQAATRAFDLRVRTYLAARAPRELGHELSYSAGIAELGGADDTLQAMLQRADMMLYNAKSAGRARTVDAGGQALREEGAAVLQLSL